MRCPECGQTSDDAAITCASCGAELNPRSPRLRPARPEGAAPVVPARGLPARRRPGGPASESPGPRPPEDARTLPAGHLESLLEEATRSDPTKRPTGAVPRSDLEPAGTSPWSKRGGGALSSVDRPATGLGDALLRPGGLPEPRPASGRTEQVALPPFRGPHRAQRSSPGGLPPWEQALAGLPRPPSAATGDELVLEEPTLPPIGTVDEPTVGPAGALDPTRRARSPGPTARPSAPPPRPSAPPRPARPSAPPVFEGTATEDGEEPSALRFGSNEMTLMSISPKGDVLASSADHGGFAAGVSSGSLPKPETSAEFASFETFHAKGKAPAVAKEELRGPEESPAPRPSLAPRPAPPSRPPPAAPKPPPRLEPFPPRAETEQGTLRPAGIVVPGGGETLAFPWDSSLAAAGPALEPLAGSGTPEPPTGETLTGLDDPSERSSQIRNAPVQLARGETGELKREMTLPGALGRREPSSAESSMGDFAEATRFGALSGGDGSAEDSGAPEPTHFGALHSESAEDQAPPELTHFGALHPESAEDQAPPELTSFGRMIEDSAPRGISAYDLAQPAALPRDGSRPDPGTPEPIRAITEAEARARNDDDSGEGGRAGSRLMAVPAFEAPPVAPKGKPRPTVEHAAYGGAAAWGAPAPPLPREPTRPPKNRRLANLSAPEPADEPAATDDRAGNAGLRAAKTLPPIHPHLPLTSAVMEETRAMKPEDIGLPAPDLAVAAAVTAELEPVREPERRVRVPGSLRRLTATVVDLALLGGALQGAFSAGLFGPHGGVLVDPDRIAAGFYAGWLFLVVATAVAVGLVGSVALHALLGRSPGKLLLGLSVIDRRTGERPRLGIALLRSVLSMVGLLALGLGPLWALLDREARALHDLATGTLVIAGGPTTSADPD